VRRVIHNGFQRFEILEFQQSRPRDAFKKFRDRFSAIDFLRGLMREPLNMMTLRKTLAEGPFRADLSRFNDYEVLAQLAQQLVSGQVKIALSPLPIPTWSHAEQAVEEEEAALGAAFVPETASWVKFKIVDDATGQPISGIKLKIKLPDGSQKELSTGVNGLIESNDIDPGTCEVSCDIKGAKLEDTLAFVAMGMPATEMKDDEVRAEPLTGLCIALIEEHNAKTGDSLNSIAQSAGLTWQELAKFNWNTQNPKEINEHLRDEVGCTKKTKDGLNYIFDDSDHPGIVYIPTKWEASGLATEKKHVIRLKNNSRFFVILENETGLRIPEAEYEASFADGWLHKGSLGIGGVDAIKNPPPGPVLVTYPDFDDIAAKSLAACARKSFDDRDPQELYRILGHSSDMIHKVIKMYGKYFDDYTGNGLVDDIYAEITDPNALRAVVGQLASAGVETREQISLVSWEQQEEDE